MNRWFQKWITRFGLDALPALRRFLIGAIGFSVVLIGLVMIVLPGPAFIVVPLGVAILATEFAWAKRYLDKARSVFKKKGKKDNRPASDRDRERVTARG